MARFGYTLFTEDHDPRDLLAHARRAEEVGFDFVATSDHFHPWLPSHDHSSFAWSLLGAVASHTERVELTTMVTCPTIRYHPAVIAQAAATIAVMSDGRFTLGLGGGERLNEHVVGAGWPPVHVRHEMLAEAITIMRDLWEGGYRSHRGRYFTVEDAQVFTRPSSPPPILVAVSGAESLAVARNHGNGLIATEPNPELVERFREGKHVSRPARGQVTVCWGEDEAKARALALEKFRFSVPGWKVMAELPNPVNFAAATEHVDEDDIAETVPCGPDPNVHVQAVQKYLDAGFDEVGFIQVGPDQEGFFRFWHEQLRPALEHT